MQTDGYETETMKMGVGDEFPTWSEPWDGGAAWMT